MNFIKETDHYTIWNEVRYLGRLKTIIDRYYFVAPKIEQPMYSYELKEIASKLDELNKDRG